MGEARAQQQSYAAPGRGDAAPGQDLGAAAQCGVKRCAQLLLAAGDNVALRVIPIVDLSSGAVVQALPFASAPQ